MKLFQIDSPLMRFLSKMADLIIINLFTLALCVPVITAGAAFTAMHYCALKIARDQEVSIVRQYFHSFKDNFKQATIIWLIFLALAGVVIFDYFLMGANPTRISAFVFGGLLAVSVVVLFVGCAVYPILARFSNTVPGTIKSAFAYSFRYFPRTLAVMVAKATPVLFIIFLTNFAIYIFPVIVCFCFSAPALLAAVLNNKPFKKAEDAYLAEHPQEDPSAGDEHIFSDTPIIEEK